METAVLAGNKLFDNLVIGYILNQYHTRKCLKGWRDETTGSALASVKRAGEIN
jgi:hypothetical protein